MPSLGAGIRLTLPDYPTGPGERKPYRLASGEVVASGNLRFHVESLDGLKVITWTDNGLTYALASDLEVGGARSCLVCHGSPEGRRKVAPLARGPVG